MRIYPTLWLLFSLKGRLSRPIYWPAVVAVFCLNFALSFQLLRIMQGETEEVPPIYLFVGAIATLYVHLAISVKRLHDMGFAGFLAIAVAIPFLNFVFAIWAGLVPGTEGPNPYGDVADELPR